MATRFVVVLLAMSAAGCSWSRFDDVSDNTPVVLLKKPDSMKAGFGVTVAAATKQGDSMRILVGGGMGQNAAAAFDLGFSDNPGIDAQDAGFCKPGDAPCYLGGKVAGLAKADVGGSELGDFCFVVGAGRAAGFDEYGLFGRCGDGTEYTLAVPNSVLKRVIKDELIDQAQAARATIRLAADKDEEAALIAGAEEQRLAWYYRPLSVEPIELIPPSGPEEGYGATQAVLRLDGARLAVVGAPESGHVWLFGGDDSDGRAVGCLGGPAGFGTAIAAGHVDDDAFDDLIVSDETSVTVISGAALAGLTPNDDLECSLSALGEGAILASFGCGSRGAVSGCPGRFGTALDVGDIDGDGDGEVIVGAPGLKVRGSSSAGAVLIYDAEGSSPEELTDVLVLSSHEDDDRLGATVAAAPIDGRDVVVAGAPGSGRTAVFYCPSMLENPGGRCE